MTSKRALGNVGMKGKLGMKKVAQLGLGLAVLLPLALSGACSVRDSKELTFDDDLLASSGGKGSSTGGGTNVGGEGGDAGSGGSTGGANTGGGANTDCTASEMRCDGRQVQICAANEWVNAGAECPFACVDSECVGLCIPDSKECIDNQTLRTCNEEGEWEEDNCKNACVEGACGGECEPGDRDCNGTEDGGKPRVRVCSDLGKWIEAEEACTDTCTDGVCIGCVGETARQCVSTTQYQQCTGTSWGSNQTCPGNACDPSNGNCVGSCVPGSSTCDDNVNYRVCSNLGVPGEPVACSGQACSGGSCVGVCQPGTTRCHPTTETIQTCGSTGQWDGTATACGSGQTCYDGTSAAVCGVCQPGDRRCVGNGSQTCTASAQWGTTRACKAGAYCYDGTCGDDSICRADPAATGCVSTAERWYCYRGLIQEAACGTKTSCKGNSGTCTSNLGI